MNSGYRTAHRQHPKASLCALLAAVGLAGCGGGNNGVSSDPVLIAEAAQSRADDTVQILADALSAPTGTGMPDEASANAGLEASGSMAANAATAVRADTLAQTAASTPSTAPDTVALTVALPIPSPPSDQLAPTEPAPLAQPTPRPNPLPDAGAAPAAAPLTSAPQDQPTTADKSVTPQQPPASVDPVAVWSSTFAKGVSDWPFKGSNWGDFNRSYGVDGAVAGRFMKVFIPKGTTDPYTMQKLGRPIGGQGMRLKPPGLSTDAARLSFKMKLPADFKPALGGKLGPGLCGGTCNGGGLIPTGTDGWSARVGFNAQGSGTVYAYLPTSVKWGTPFGTIPLILGSWNTIVQEVRLNDVGRANGSVKAWVNGMLVIDQRDLLFRTTSALKIDGVYFDTFFGGQSENYAAPEDTSFEFAELAVFQL